MKKLTPLLISLVLTVILCFPAFGANVTDKAANGKIITITGLDTDWWSTKPGPNGLGTPGDLEIEKIIFYPGATGDIMIIHDGAIDSEEVGYLGTCADVYDRIEITFETPKKCQPVIDISDCTLGTAANARVVIHLK